MTRSPRIGWKLGPIAHRGLHNEAKGIIENTTSSVKAAMAKGYGIEVDVQAARDATPMVFHDEALERIMDAKGLLIERTPAELQRMAYQRCADRMMTLDELLELVAGRSPLLIEIKTLFGKPGEFERKIARSVAAYRGPVALMSFDPYAIGACRQPAPQVPLGLTSYRWDDDWMSEVSASLKRRMRKLKVLPEIGASFVAYDIDDLPALPPLMANRLWGYQLLSWTVRTPEQRAKARKYVDAIIFEGFEPQAH